MSRNFLFSTKLYAGWLLVIFGLTGCKLGKDYQRPELALPTQYRQSAPADTVSTADMPWREFFREPVLQQLINGALTNNFDLQLALKRLEESQAYVRQSRYALLPAVSGQVFASSTTPSKNSLNGLNLENFIGTTHLEDYTANIGLSWEIDIWGKIRRQNEATVARYLQTVEAARAVRTSLVATVADQYFNLLMLDAQIAVARKNVALGDSIIRLIRFQKEAGEATALAVQQAEAQKQTAELVLSQLEQATVIQENSLRLLTGDLPGTVARPASLAVFPLADTLTTGVPAKLLGNRPDVRADEMALIAANAQLGVAQANLYPALTLTASGGLNAFRAANWFTIPTSLFFNVAGGLTQPIFQRRQLKTGLEVAAIQRDQALIQFRRSLTTAVGEVTNALVSVGKARQQEQIAAVRANTLRQAVTNAQLLFRSGMATYLEVITAQSNALQAELSQAETRRQQLGAMVELYRSLGGGWK